MLEKPVRMQSVVTAKTKMIVTQVDPIRGRSTVTNYWECKLDCGHCVYRRVGGGDAPKWLACAACTDRSLTTSELNRRGAPKEVARG